jgi:hypothetical protein
MSRARRLKSAVRLRLEALENRCCPSCDVSVIDGHILRILGDETANRIEIRQTSDGMTNLSCDGATAAFRGINEFDIATGASNDFVTANFQNPPDGDFNFRADLGAGNDVMNIDWQDPTHYDEAQPPRDMHFNVFTGAGNDVFDARFINPRDPNLSFIADLGAGDNRVTINWQQPPDPELQALFDIATGAGNDELTAVLPSTGKVNFHANLGGGNNIFDAVLTQPPDPDRPGESQPPEPDRQTLIEVLTGAGNDRVTANLSQPPDGDFVFRASLGGGNNIFDAVLTAPPEPDRPGEVSPPDPDRQTLIEVLTGAGNDRVTINGVSPPDGDFVFRADLGGGNNIFDAVLQSPPEPDRPGESQPPEPERQTLIEVLTGAGNDRMSLLLGGPDTGPQPQLFNTALTVNFDGGGGDNTASIEIQNVVVNAPMSLSYDGGLGDEAIIVVYRDVAANAPMTQAVNTGGGDDNAMIIYGNVAFNADTTTNVNLGGGDDVAALNAYNVAFNADVVTNVMGGGGGDTVGFVIDGGNVAAGASLAVNADGGGGGDTVGIVIEGSNVAAGASLMVDVDGGGGADTVGIIISGGTVARDALLEIEVHGGDGADVLRFSTVGLLVDGEFVWCQDGGDGNDVIDARLDLDPDSHGMVNAEVMGGAGDDDLTLGISGLGGPDTFQALVDGGAGFDTAHVSRVLLPFVFNCEQVIPIG